MLDGGCEEDGQSDLTRMFEEFLARLGAYEDALLYFNPERHSMMLFAVEHRFPQPSGESNSPPARLQGELQFEELRDGEGPVPMDGGAGWKPGIELVHEYCMLPRMQRPNPRDYLHRPIHTASGRVYRGTNCKGYALGEEDENAAAEACGGGDIWGGVTSGCGTVQSMQNYIFALGFGPLPFFRRPGVIVFMSPDEAHEGDASTYLMGCIVSHTPGLHGCVGSSMSNVRGCDSHRCYLCTGNPFVEVLFHNPARPYLEIETARGADEEEGEGLLLLLDGHSSRGSHCSGSGSGSREGWKTVPVTPRRAFMHVLQVGAKLMLSVDALCRIMGSFQPRDQAHIIKHVKAQMAAEDATPSHAAGSSGQIGHSSKGQRKKGVRRRSSVRDEEENGEDAAMHAVGKCMVRCYLNVTSVLRCREGFACVAISCALTGARNAGREVRNLYVSPQHLQMPEDEQQWDKAFHYVFI